MCVCVCVCVCMCVFWHTESVHTCCNHTTTTTTTANRTMGMKNMLATECSRPMDTNADTGSRHDTNLPHSELVAVACHNAMHTSQLQSTPRTKAWRVGGWVWYHYTV